MSVDVKFLHFYDILTVYLYYIQQFTDCYTNDFLMKVFTKSLNQIKHFLLIIDKIY